MTYPELLIALDIDDPKIVMSNLTSQYLTYSNECNGQYLVVCDEGDIHAFDENGKEHDIDCIPSYCFAHQFLNKIIIPEGVTHIRDGAFYYCTNLESIAISNTVTTICASAFFKNYSLTRVTIPDSVISIGRFAFGSCMGLNNVAFGKRVKCIDDHAFSYCGNLTSIVLPDSVATVGQATFQKCFGLKSVVMPQSIQSIGLTAFVECYDLETVVFKEKTIEQVKAMDHYPWGITDESIIHIEH